MQGALMPQCLPSLNKLKMCILTVWRVDAQIDGHGRNALVGASHALRLRFDLATNLTEVNKLLAFAVEELRIF